MKDLVVDQGTDPDMIGIDLEADHEEIGLEVEIDEEDQRISMKMTMMIINVDVQVAIDEEATEQDDQVIIVVMMRKAIIVEVVAIVTVMIRKRKRKNDDDILSPLYNQNKRASFPPVPFIEDKQDNGGEDGSLSKPSIKPVSEYAPESNHKISFS